MSTTSLRVPFGLATLPLRKASPIGQTSSVADLKFATVGGCSSRGVIVSNQRDLLVRVSQRILWIGAEAYPLHNIARAQTIKIVRNRGAVFRRYVGLVVLWGFLGVAATAASSYYGSRGASVHVGGSSLTSAHVRSIIVAVMAGLIAISTIWMIIAMFTPARYALVIETSGSPRTALVTTDEHVVTDLVHRIMYAINNPQAEFRVLVKDLHIGDKINQFGSQSVGKQVYG
jgi:uncharacterized protein DUF6232